MGHSDDKRSPSLRPDAWGEVVHGYEETAEKLTSLFVDELLDAVDPCADLRVLDVATGPGVVAEAAARRGGRVTAVDFSSEMVERARRRLTDAGFRC